MGTPYFITTGISISSSGGWACEWCSLNGLLKLNVAVDPAETQGGQSKPPLCG
jgi:hypothetical protein